MAALPRQTNVINAATVKFADNEAGLTGADTYECVITGLGFTPSANTIEIPATGCAPASQTAAASSWVCNIAWLQDWQSTGGGLSGYMFENDSLTKWVSVEPTSPALPDAVAEVVIISGPVYGTFGELLTATADLAASNKPTITLPVVMTAGAGKSEAA